MPNENDFRTLDLLGIFHYVLAGIAALFACFQTVAGHDVFMKTLTGSANSFERFLFYVGATFVISMLGLAILLFLSGRKLRRRKHRTFSIVVAGIACVFTPLGTVLGVFTLILLNKGSVMELYESSGARYNGDTSNIGG